VSTLPKPIDRYDVADRRDFEVLPKHPRSLIRGFEHVSIGVGNAINSKRRLKAFMQFFGRTVTATWIHWIAGRRLRLFGQEHIDGLRPERGVVLVSNHRSFFDMYVASSMLYRRKASWMRRLFFPVRTKFFYTNPLGLLINLAMSGCAMWPPVFRDERKAALNPTSMRQIGCALASTGAVLGFHPEGTRGKGPDPYELLPPKAGVGQILRVCHPDTVVLPFFILGMSSDIKQELVYMVRPPADGSGDIRIHFDAPMTAGELSAGRDAQEIADHLHSVLVGLGEQDRAVYGALEPK
jgi:1-acyl-sn-glycerol-3-phosphate acyltransferase